ncbi:hypothetical protein PAPYR_11357 [Paratrimastix pyriformis]|uniref:Uncharacterized protein n=1 Tax=Paratrimastix pyriformis TaxID=342808 RepID=A0ABQ8U9M2_9EUKA|nr:hypothetical protein PAPYR_11357 [Paratrimastix pyriformis]
MFLFLPGPPQECPEAHIPTKLDRIRLIPNSQLFTPRSTLTALRADHERVLADQAAEQRTSGAQRANLKKALEELTLTAAQSSQRADEAEAEKAALAARCGQLEADLATAQATLASHPETAAALAAARTECAEQKARVEQLAPVLDDMDVLLEQFVMLQKRLEVTELAAQRAGADLTALRAAAEAAAQAEGAGGSGVATVAAKGIPPLSTIEGASPQVTLASICLPEICSSQG